MKRYYLGIDQGTSGTTALLVDTDWRVVAAKNVEHTQIYPHPGWVEHSPEEIWGAIQTAAADVLRQANASPNQIRAIGIAHQGETCTVWEKDTGRPIYNAIVWQDRRTAEDADALNEKYGTVILEKTSLKPDAYYSATKLNWILNHVEGARERMARGELQAGTLDAWMIWKFTGGAAFVTDPSTASRTMLMDLKKGDWDQQLLDIFEIPRTILPQIANSSEVYGYTTPDAFFGARVPVACCITDALGALLAQGCLHRGDLKTTYGTGCFMSMNLGKDVQFSKDGLSTVAAWKIANETSYAFDGGVYIAGAAIRWLRDKLRIIGSTAESERIAMSTPDTGGVYFVPAFSGLAAPTWDQYARGLMIGITGITTSEHIVRATLESIAFQVYNIADVMCKNSGYDFSVMKADGGPTLNRFLMQFQADILGKPIEIPEITEMTGYGAAFLAALALGDVDSVSDIQHCWNEKRCFEPQMSQTEREFRLEQWDRAVERCRGWEIPQR